MKAYIAARFSRLEAVKACAAELEAAGITVTSRWFRGGHEWVGTPDEEIPVHRNAQFAAEDLEDINAADVLVCLTEPARSGPPHRGGDSMSTFEAERARILAAGRAAAYAERTTTPFGALLETHRHRAKLSMKRLSALVYCDWSYISRLESGQRGPSRDMVTRLADALELTPADRVAFFASAGYLERPLPDAVCELLALLDDAGDMREIAEARLISWVSHRLAAMAEGRAA